MSAVREVVTSSIPDQQWKQIAELEEQHLAIQQSHERLQRSLDEAVRANRDDLQSTWHRYRAVVAELSRVTGDFDFLRRGLG
jgi:hypothetical protein